MVCIYCSSPTTVTNSRLQRHGNHIWRRRKCLACGNVFTTQERAELSGAFMVSGSPSPSRDGLKPFNRDALFLTIYESCKHRPNAIAEAAALTQTVINKLIEKHPDGAIKRDTIARQAHQVLRRFDAVAATFYAAYHQVEL